MKIGVLLTLLSIFISTIVGLVLVLSTTKQLKASIHNGILTVESEVRLSNGKVLAPGQHDLTGQFGHAELLMLEAPGYFPTTLRYLKTYFSVSNAKDDVFTLKDESPFVTKKYTRTESNLTVLIEDKSRRSSCFAEVKIYGPPVATVMNGITTIVNPEMPFIDFINGIPAVNVNGQWTVNQSFDDVHVSYNDGTTNFTSQVGESNSLTSEIFVNSDGLTLFTSSIPLSKIRITHENKIIGEYFPDYISP